jgi:hypothetical protein
MQTAPTPLKPSTAVAWKSIRLTENLFQSLLHLSSQLATPQLPPLAQRCLLCHHSGALCTLSNAQSRTHVLPSAHTSPLAVCAFTVDSLYAYTASVSIIIPPSPTPHCPTHTFPPSSRPMLHLQDAHGNTYVPPIQSRHSIRVLKSLLSQIPPPPSPPRHE